MGSQTEEALEEHPGEAARASVVRVAEGENYSFNHALTQQVLYRELAPRRRKRLHLAAGMAIAQQSEHLRDERAAELAWHFLEAGEADKALRYATLAGDQAENRFAHHEAERHYQMALELAEQRGETAHEAVI